MSAFFFYLKARREGLKKEQPTLSNTEIVSKMTAEWKALTDKDKEPYIKSAEKDKDRYAKEKKAYDEKKKKCGKEEKCKAEEPKKPKKIHKKVTKRTAKKKAEKKH